ncbi:MAG: hemerythrin domain-containing protein [Myxococcota bacterium]|nr:hemerythrin domain-containing protein [Myxococcota bacterium]
MLVTLGTRPQARTLDQSDPNTLLLDCHERIRRFSSLGVRLATVQAPPPEIAEVASRVHRYFTVALPLHVADEDLSVRPRLLAAHPSRELVDALGTMTSEHLEIEDLLAELTSVWSTLIEDPTRLASFGAQLTRASTHLEELLRRHLTLEEEVVLPSLSRLLPPEVQAELVREMRARRGVGG